MHGALFEKLIFADLNYTRLIIFEDPICVLDYCENDWNEQVQQQLKEYEVSSKSESTLDTLMKWYIGTLNIVHFKNIVHSRQFIRAHLNSFNLCFNNLKCSFTDNYLDNVENILPVYIRLHIISIELKDPYSFGRAYKKYIRYIVSKLRFFATTQLLKREDLLSHVLMKIKMNECAAVSKDILNLIYRKLLTDKPKDKSELSFCRAYILLQKWKKILEEDKRKYVDKEIYDLYGKTPESLQQNAILKKILLPQSNSFLDVLTVSENYVVFSDRYFKFIKNVPMEEGNILPVEKPYLDSISLQELNQPQTEEFIEKNNNSHYDDYVNREKNNGHDNKGSTSIDSVDLLEATTIKTKEDDDCQIVNIEFPKPRNVQLIHEFIEDDDIVEIIMPDTFLKKDKDDTLFLESISQYSSNQVDRLKKSTDGTFLNSIVISGSSKEDSMLVEESFPEISNSKKANNFQSEKRNHVTFNNNLFDSNDIKPHFPPRKSDCVLKGTLKKSFSSDRESVEVIPINTSKSVSTVATQTETLMEQDDDLIMSQRQSKQPSTKHRNKELIQAPTISISAVQIFDSNIELTNAVQDSENQVLDNSSRVDSTASCSLELLPQVNSDLIDENTHQKPDSNQVDSPENSNLSKKGAMDNESARPVEANAHIDSSLSPTLSLINKSSDGDTYKSLVSPDISSTSVNHSPSDGSNRVIQGILKKSKPAVKKLRSFIVPESINYIPIRKSSTQMDNLKNHSKTQNSNSAVKNMLRKTFEEEENVGYYSPPDINGDLQNIDVIKKNPSLDTSTKRLLRPRIPRKLLNMESLEMYNVKPDDVCIQSDPCVIVEKLPQEEIDGRLKLSAIFRKLRLERELRQQSSYPISAVVRVDYDKHTTHIGDKDVVRFNSPNPGQVTVSSPNSWRNVSSHYPEHEEGTVTSCNFVLSKNYCIRSQNVCSCEENLAFELTKLNVVDSVSNSYSTHNQLLPEPKRRNKRKHSAESINNSVPNFKNKSEIMNNSYENANLSFDISKETNITYAIQCKLSDIENASVTQKSECINSARIKTNDKCEESLKEQTNIDKSNTVAKKTDGNVWDIEYTETRLPLKKRKLSPVANSC